MIVNTEVAIREHFINKRLVCCKIYTFMNYINKISDIL